MTGSEATAHPLENRLDRVAGSTTRRLIEWLRRPAPFDPLTWYVAFVFVSWINFHAVEKLDFLVIQNNGIVFLVSLVEVVAWSAALIFLETIVFSVYGQKRWLKFLRSLAVCTAGAILFFDFIVYQWVSMHIPTVIEYLFSGGVKNIALNFNVTGVAFAEVIQKVLTGSAVVAIATLAVYFGDLWIAKKNVTVRPASLFSVGVISLLVLSGLEQYEFGLDPGGKTRREHLRVIATSFSLSKRRDAPLIVNAHITPRITAPITVPKLSALPDIYLVVIESLRSDVIQPDICPTLFEIKARSAWQNDCASAGNATHISWYSLFTGNWPVYLDVRNRGPQQWGSRALKAFRDAGYKIHVTASSYLRYCDLDRRLLGENRELATSYLDADDLLALPIFDRDREITRKVCEMAQEGEGGRFFIISYDSTHHDYSFPETFKPVRESYAGSLEYSQMGVPPERAVMLKNRYLNALAYVDSLLGELTKQLRQSGRLEKAIFCVTGDHGEEFSEHGILGHATDFCRNQIRVPLMINLPEKSPGRARVFSTRSASHTDILPTLLDYLGIETRGAFNGESLYSKTNTFMLVASQNGPRDPSDFCIETGDLKFLMSFRDGGGPLAMQSQVYLKKILGPNDQPIMQDSQRQDIVAQVDQQIGPFLRRLFPSFQFK